MKDTQVTLRINSELKNKAKQYAEDTGRTLASLIEYLLKKEIERPSK
ncbi:MAG: DUF6364 family protein [Phycisphaerae bacterium]|nr:DUF6364 family protein [Phycisphaerae bacterium]